MTRAVVKLLPRPEDVTGQMGAQMAQAFGALGMAPAGGRIPVDVPPEDREMVVEGATRSENDAHVVRFFDESGRERALVPLHRVDTVRFE